MGRCALLFIVSCYALLVVRCVLFVVCLLLYMLCCRMCSLSFVVCSLLFIADVCLMVGCVTCSFVVCCSLRVVLLRCWSLFEVC